MTPEVEFLRNRVAELEGLLGLKLPQPRPSGISVMGWRMLGLLLKHSVVPREFALTAIYGDETDDPPQSNTISQTVCRLNKILRPKDITITAERDIGYYLTTENRRRLNVLITGAE